MGLEDYRRTQIQTAPPEKLVLMLYDGALRNVAAADRFLSEGDREGLNRATGKAQDILAELRSSLNYEAGELADRLAALYDFAARRLMEGNIRQDRRALEEARQILRGLRDAWAEMLRS